jgi:hypothetical protein
MSQFVMVLALLGCLELAMAYPALYAASSSCTTMPTDAMGRHKAPKDDP